MPFVQMLLLPLDIGASHGRLVPLTGEVVRGVAVGPRKVGTPALAVG